MSTTYPAAEPQDHKPAIHPRTRRPTTAAGTHRWPSHFALLAGGETLTTDGPVVGMKEAVGGWFILVGSERLELIL